MAEKLETVISRNVTNTRMRDFYDIYILQKLYGEQLKKEVLWKAYQKNYYYAANISWQMVMQSIRFLYEISYNDNERTIIHE